jgi:hypothetical protein
MARAGNPQSDGINILSAAYDDILFPVNEVNKPFLIHTSHISGEKPAFPQHGGGGFGIVVVAFHDAGAPDDQFAHLSLWDF